PGQCSPSAASDPPYQEDDHSATHATGRRASYARDRYDPGRLMASAILGRPPRPTGRPPGRPRVGAGRGRSHMRSARVIGSLAGAAVIPVAIAAAPAWAGPTPLTTRSAAPAPAALPAPA